MLDNVTLKREALNSLNDNWGLAVGAILVSSLLMLGAASLAVVGSWIICGPMTVGVYLFFRDLARKQTPTIDRLFEGFHYFVNTMIAGLLVIIFTLLWTCLLIVPGIIAALAYSQTFNILAEHPEMNAMDAIRRSREVMTGEKSRYFGFVMSFFGWFLLCAITCGVAFLYVGPYFAAAQTQFFLDLKQDKGI